MFNLVWTTNSWQSGRVSTNHNANNLPGVYTKEDGLSSKYQDCSTCCHEGHILSPDAPYETVVMKRDYRIRRHEDETTTLPVLLHTLIR